MICETMRNSPTIKISLLSILVVVLLALTSASGIIPYEGQEFTTEYTESLTCEQGLDEHDTYKTSFTYLNIDEDNTLVHDHDLDSFYTINLDDREVNHLNSGETNDETSHWINTDIEDGDTLQLGSDQYTVESISDSTRVDALSINIDSIRLEDEWNTNIRQELTTRPKNPTVTEEYWYSADTGIFLKQEISSDFELRTGLGWVSCTLKEERELVDTGQDTSRDGVSDLQKILSTNEDSGNTNPEQKDVELEIEVEENISVHEGFEIEVNSDIEGIEPELYINDQKIDEGKKFDAVFSEHGRYDIEVRKDNREVNEVTHNYIGDSKEIVVRELLPQERIIHVITNLSDLFDRSDLNEKYLISNSQTSDIILGVENDGSEDVNEDRSVSLGTESVKQEVSVSSRSINSIMFEFNEEPGTHTASSNRLDMETEILETPKIEVEDIISPEKISEKSREIVELEVSNIGGSGRVDLPLVVDGQERNQDMYLSEEETKSTEFTVFSRETGEIKVEAGDQTKDIRVVERPEFQVENIELDSENVILGDDIKGTIEVSNIGGIEGDYDLSIFIEDANTLSEEVLSEEINIVEGETERVDFEISRDTIGSYNITAGNEVESVDVNPYVWEATTGEQYDATTEQMIGEKDTFQEGERVNFVFRYSIAQNDATTYGLLEHDITYTGPDEEIIGTGSSEMFADDSEDIYVWNDFGTTGFESGEHTIELHIRNQNRGISKTTETSFIVN